MEFLSKLAESGILGLLLVIAMLAIYFLYKEIKALQEKRITDLKEMSNQVLEPVKSIRTTVEAILSKLNNRP